MCWSERGHRSRRSRTATPIRGILSARRLRSPRLTEVADFFVLRTLLSHTLKHLPRWMKPQKVRTPLHLQPAQGWIQRQPLGVVGVIAPWNYPVQLSLAPAITALAGFVPWAEVGMRQTVRWLSPRD